ncbi:MAG: low molecular weight phosphotyrosine protein phosphatase [Rickettsiales bacterium]|nr:low molecular weight phosphotyrosine protein phosphatase [Rickettsiales bacterium]
MIKILVVCTGNICRSPVAHAVLDDLVKKSEFLKDNVFIDSCGTHNYHVGSKPDKRSVQVAKENGLDISYISSRLLKDSDKDFDLILGMDRGHFAALKENFPDAKNKVFLFSYYSCDQNKDIKDPYFGDYEGFIEMFSEIAYVSSKLIIKLENELRLC